MSSAPAPSPHSGSVSLVSHRTTTMATPGQSRNGRRDVPGAVVIMINGTYTPGRRRLFLRGYARRFGISFRAFPSVIFWWSAAESPSFETTSSVSRT
jgi:hypothetical protein